MSVGHFNNTVQNSFSCDYGQEEVLHVPWKGKW